MNLLFDFLLLFLAAFPAAGNPVHLPKKTLTVDQVLRPRIISDDVISHAGIAAYARALGKFGASLDTVRFLSALAVKHGSLSKRAEQDPPNPYPQVAGPLPAVPGAYDIFYTTRITIGDQQFWMDFDTGSSDLWVFGPDVTGLAMNQTNWHQSSTSQKLDGYSFYIGYGDGSYASGDVWTDQIMLGSVIVSNASVEVAKTAGGSFGAPISGIVGLGFDQNNEVSPVQQKTLFTELISRNLISQPVLATHLNHNEPGCYTFGDIPWWQYSGSIVYTPVDQSDGYWTISPLGYGVCGGENKISTSSLAMNNSDAARSVLTGVVDTGTTLILVDDSIAYDYWSSVPTAILDYFIFGGYVFDCSENLPDLKILIGEDGRDTYTLTVPGTYINYQPLGSNLCYGAVQPTFGQIPFNIYGDVLIKSAFIVFDRGEGGQGPPRMGFADKAKDDTPAAAA